MGPEAVNPPAARAESAIDCSLTRAIRAAAVNASRTPSDP